MGFSRSDDIIKISLFVLIILSMYLLHSSSSELPISGAYSAIFLMFRDSSSITYAMINYKNIFSILPFELKSGFGQTLNAKPMQFHSTSASKWEKA